MSTGKSLATAKQKKVAKKTINKTKPWKRSTGPRSDRGKIVSRLNACSKSNTRKVVLRSWDFPSLELFEEACLSIETLMQQLSDAIAKFREKSITSIRNFIDEGIIATFIFQIKY
jgi:hypothetical protein